MFDWLFSEEQKKTSYSEVLSVENTEPNSIVIQNMMPETKEGTRKSDRPYVKRDRVAKKELQNCFLKDAICTRAVNTYQSVIPQYSFVYENDKDKAFWEDWIKKSNFTHEFSEAIKDICIYGDAYMELMKTNGRTVGVAELNPEYIDYQKEGDFGDQIKLDEHGNPVGYIQVPPGSFGSDKRILFSKDDIFNLRFQSAGDGFYGVGIIEPIYNITRWKLNLLEGYAEAVQKVGFPIKMIIVGDQQHEPGIEEMQQGLRMAKKIDTDKVGAIPYWSQFTMLEPKGAMSGIAEKIDNYIDQQIIGTGIPKPLLTGLGGDTNRQTLIYQTLDWERNIENKQRNLAFQCEGVLFKQVAIEHGIKTIPSFLWDPIGLKDKTELSKRLKTYYDIGLLSQKDIERIKPIIFEWENLEDKTRGGK